MKIFISFFLCLSVAVVAAAQHCPFDGGEMLVVELVDQNNEPISGASLDIKLFEVDNEQADACKYSPGLLELNFTSPVEAFMSTYRQSSDVFSRYCADCTFTRDGFYAVILGQGERSCAIADEKGDLKWQTRKYELRYRNGSHEQTMALERRSFFSMCTGSGKWSRFEPVKLKLGTTDTKKS